MTFYRNQYNNTEKWPWLLKKRSDRHKPVRSVYHRGIRCSIAARSSHKVVLRILFLSFKTCCTISNLPISRGLNFLSAGSLCSSISSNSSTSGTSIIRHHSSCLITHQCCQRPQTPITAIPYQPPFFCRSPHMSPDKLHRRQTPVHALHVCSLREEPKLFFKT